MGFLTHYDWVQWKMRDAIENCDDAVRDRFDHFVAYHVAKRIWKLSEWERSRLGDYQEDTAEGRRRRATQFDAHMLNGRKKEALFSLLPRNPNPTEDDYAAAWSAYAIKCICTMVRERIQKDVKPPPGPLPEELDKALGDDDDTTLADLTADENATTEDLISLGEVEQLAATVELSEREQLILWADQYGEPRCSEKMCELAGCEKTQLSACARRLGRRLYDEIDRLFQLAPSEKMLAVDWAAHAWRTLMLRFENYVPERDAHGPLRWIRGAKMDPPNPHAFTP